MRAPAASAGRIGGTLALVAMSVGAAAQPTRDLGLPPPFDTPALPPAVNPALPPQPGQRYLPGTGGPFADPDRPPARSRPFTRARPLEGLAIDVRPDPAAGAPSGIGRQADIGAALRACWQPPAGEAGPVDATIRFSLRRDGALVGEPRVTYVNRAATPARRDELVGSMRAALARCAPFALTPAFGSAVAGRPISVRFILGAPGRRA